MSAKVQTSCAKLSERERTNDLMKQETFVKRHIALCNVLLQDIAQGDMSFNEGLIKMVVSYKKGTRSKNSFKGATRSYQTEKIPQWKSKQTGH